MKWRVFFCVAWLAFPASVAQAAISGTVFRDYDSDGVRDPGEPGLAGVRVSAYGPGGTAVGSSPRVTVADGSYTLTGVPAGLVRVEVTLPADRGYLKPGVAGGTTVMFVQDGAVLTTAFQLPADYCEEDPPLFAISFVTLDNIHPLDEYDHRFVPVSAAVPFSADSTSPELSWLTAAGEMGAVYGVAWQTATGRLFASSYVKSMAGLGPDGGGGEGTTTGGLYEITPAEGGGATASLFLNLAALPQVDTGADPHPSPADLCTSTVVGDTNNTGCWYHDPGTFAVVGKRGLGDLDFNSDETRLYTVNLNDRTLVMLPVGVPAVAPPPSAVEVFPTPTADCANPADARPFALARHDDPNRIYLGVTCTAQSSQAASDLALWIYEFDRRDGPGSQVYTPVYHQSLDYTRARATGFFGGLCDAARCPATWRPWQDDFALLNRWMEGKRSFVVAHPQPLLADFAFDGGDLVLAIRDRSADQGGIGSGNPTDFADTRDYSWYQAGDLLRACDADGDPATVGWTLESNGTCGGVTGAGAGNTDGPGPFPANGELYRDELFVGGQGQSELFSGGLVQIPGRDRVATTSLAATAFDEGAVTTWSRASGERSSAARLYLSRFDPEFGAANGLGDLEALCAPAPLELGNRLWCDGDGDGVQDPGEAGVNGVAVELHCGAANPVSVTTSGDGNYLFTDALYAAANGGAALPRRLGCTISIPTAGANGAVLRAACGGALPSPADQGGADAGADLRDSDGLLVGSEVTLAVATGGPGANDHSLDQGFVAEAAPPTLFDFGDAPAPYPTLLASDGARHILLASGNPTLGGVTDAETDGQPSATAAGDDENGVPDDEDGVTFPGLLLAGTNGSVRVSTGATGGRLDAWIDWNHDGDWSDPGERIADGLPLGAGAQTDVSFPVPFDAAVGGAMARFRLSSAGGLGPTGPAPDGEVEDEEVTVGLAPLDPPIVGIPVLGPWGVALLGGLLAAAALSVMRRRTSPVR